MNKRDFVVSAGAMLGAGHAWSGLAVRPPPLPAGAQGLAAWRKDIGASFAVIGPSGAPRIRLERVHHYGADARLEQYTLVFSTPGTLPSGTHMLRRDDGRVLALYLDEAGHGREGTVLLRADCSCLD